jgi:transposase
VLYHLKGMEQARIAEQLGVSRRTILYRLGELARRARDLEAEADGHKPEAVNNQPG